MYKVKIKAKDRQVVISHIENIRRFQQKVYELLQRATIVCPAEGLDGIENWINRIDQCLKEVDHAKLSKRDH
jgi:hypothetical protein